MPKIIFRANGKIIAEFFGIGFCDMGYTSPTYKIYVNASETLEFYPNKYVYVELVDDKII